MACYWEVWRLFVLFTWKSDVMRNLAVYTRESSGSPQWKPPWGWDKTRTSQNATSLVIKSFLKVFGRFGVSDPGFDHSSGEPIVHLCQIASTFGLPVEQACFENKLQFRWNSIIFLCPEYKITCIVRNGKHTEKNLWETLGGTLHQFRNNYAPWSRAVRRAIKFSSFLGELGCIYLGECHLPKRTRASLLKGKWG